MRRNLLEQMGMPVGDPFGGPAYGKREDIGTALSVGGSLLGGFISSKGAQSAADTQASATDRAAQLQADATNKSTEEIARQYDLTRSDAGPYRAAGNNALAKLQLMLGLNPGAMTDGNGSVALTGADNPGWQSAYDSAYKSLYDDANAQHQAAYGMPLAQSGDAANLQKEMDALKAQATQQANTSVSQQPGASTPASSDPSFGNLNKKFSVADFWNDPVVSQSYQAGLDLGTKALKNMAPLTTGLDSGAALKELTKFGTDYTGNMAAGSQNRFVGDQTNQFNRLMGIISGGQTANATTAGAGTAAASGIAGATMAGGTNAANLYSSLGNAQGAAKIAGANSFGNGLSSVSNFWNQQQMLDRIAGRGTSMPNNFNGGYSANPTYNYDSYGTTG